MITILKLRDDLDRRTILNVLHPMDPALSELSQRMNDENRLTHDERQQAVVDYYGLKRRLRAVKIHEVLAQGGYEASQEINGDNLAAAKLQISGNRRSGDLKVGDLARVDGQYFVADDCSDDRYKFVPL